MRLMYCVKNTDIEFLESEKHTVNTTRHGRMRWTERRPQ